MASSGKSRESLHPAERIAAPKSIESGRSLKDLISPQLVKLIGESIENVFPGFKTRRFVRAASGGLESLELKQRARVIAEVLRAELPEDFREASRILIESLGPPLSATSGNGLGGFFYLPHSELIATAGLHDFEAGMRANLELTQRFTAEFCIRPYLEKYPEKSLRLLRQWAKSPNPHVRRLVSEGTRPRLPWGSRLRVFTKAPETTLGLLELLKDDEELYVRRSVANHLGDLLKDHPEVIYAHCERWLAEVSKKSVKSQRREERCWILRHAVRLPAKKNESRAIELRRKAR